MNEMCTERRLKIIFALAIAVLAGQVLLGPFLGMPRARVQELTMVAQEQVWRQGEKGDLLFDGQAAQGLSVAPGRAVFSGAFAAVSGKVTTAADSYIYGVLFKRLPFSEKYFCDTRYTEVTDSQTAIFAVFPNYGLIHYRLDIGPISLRVERSVNWERVLGLTVLLLVAVRVFWKRRKARKSEEDGQKGLDC